MNETQSVLVTKLETGATWALVLCAFCLPISSGAMNGTMLIALLLKIATLYNKNARQTVLNEYLNPNFKGVWLFVGLLTVSSFYGEGSLKEASHFGFKHSEWLLMPLFASCIRKQKDWENLMGAFVLSMAFCLLISVVHAVWGLDQLPAYVHNSLSLGPREEPTVFRLRITFGLFMTLAGAYCLLNAHRHFTYLILGIAAWLDTLLLVRSRTAFVTLGVLILWLMFSRLNRKTALLLSVIGLISAATAFTQIGRLNESVSEIRDSLFEWSPQNTQHERSSEQRLNFWYGAVGVIKQSPVFGVGLGGYTGAFSKAVADTNISKENKNPHQQYLLIAAQTGLLGLGVFLLSQLMLYKAASDLELPVAKQWVQIVLISFAAGNLFNSFFLDSGEGLFFAIMVGSALGLWSQNSVAKKSIRIN